MGDRFCPRCNQQDHHRPDCPEMSFPSGRRRDDPGPSAPLKPVEPSRRLPLHFESPLSEELARIFAGSTERMIERHVKAMRARAR